MRNLIFLVSFFFPVIASAEILYCRTHSYGDTTYEISVDTRKLTATIIGSDRWYHEDFFKAVVKNLSLISQDSLIHVNGEHLSMVIDRNSRTAFGSPAIFQRKKLDFDCRE